MRGRRRGIALLVVVVAVGVVDALLALLWLSSRAEARDAAESLAVSRAEWAAAAAMTEATHWLARRDSLAADTVLTGAPAGMDAARSARLRRLSPTLVEVRAEGRVPATGPALVTRVRCLWLVPGPPDSAGVALFRPVPASGPADCW